MKPTVDIMNHTSVFLRPLLVRMQLAGLVVLLAFAPAFAAVKIQEVRSDSGVTAWLVEDYTVPIIAVRFAFEGGSVQNPAGKEGLASLMSGLFDEGAGDLDSAAYQERLDKSGLSLRFDAQRDVIYGSARMLSRDAAEGFDLLRLAVQEPRFDQAPIDRIRAQLTAKLLGDARDPQTQARKEFRRALYGDHPYARDDDGTPETLASITAEDLKAFHKRLFARDNLHVAVVGAISPEDLKGVLDKVFAGLPEKAELTPVQHVAPKLDQTVRYEYDLAQTGLQLVYPGVARDDPAFFPAYLMNHILGGGTFSSRLFDEVREKRGLVYGVGSGLVSQKYSDSLVIGTSTRPERAAETLSVIRETVAKMADEGPTQDELDKGKKYLIGSYPINNLDSSEAIASTLVELQVQDLGIDYIDRRQGLINAVPLDAVKAEAKRLLSTEPAVMVVGRRQTDGG
jgi:zinc protease